MTAPYVPGPAGQPAAYGPAPAATGAGRSFWRRGPGVMLITIGVGLALFALLAVSGVFATTNDVEVKVTKCNAGLVAASVDFEVTNTSKATRTVTIAIEYRDQAGKRVDTDQTVVRDIAPGDTVRDSEPTVLPIDPVQVRCSARVVSVS